LLVGLKHEVQRFPAGRIDLQVSHETIYTARPPTPQSAALEPSSIASVRSADSP
jgi:hypothetical protein